MEYFLLKLLLTFFFIFDIHLCSDYQCVDDYCTAYCEDCDGAIIDFRNAKQGSRLICDGPDSCIGITLYCPLSIDSECTQENDECFDCEIVGRNNNIYHFLSDWTIYAQNSWNDLTITNLYGYIQGTMYCNDNFTESCSIQYGLWQCDNNQSECYTQNENEQNIYCSDDKQCYNQNITCNDVDVAVDDGVCNIICSGSESCSSSIIYCGNNAECNILCLGSSSCQGIPIENINDLQNNEYDELPSIIYCPSSNNCSVICGKSTDDQVTSSSCLNSFIISSNSRSDLNINAMGSNSLTNARIFGPSYGDINVQCNEYESCNNALFYGNTSKNLNIACNYDEQETAAVCNDMTIYCPPATDIPNKNCHISGPANDYHTSLQLYCVDGWSDIDISTEYRQNSAIDPNGDSTMHCSGDSDYDENCLIRSSDFNCECPPDATSAPTNSPTTAPTYFGQTFEPTDDSKTDDSHKKQTGYIVGGVFLGFAVIAGIVGLIYCFIYHKADDQKVHDSKDNKKDNENDEKKKKDDKNDGVGKINKKTTSGTYQSVQPNDDNDDDDGDIDDDNNKPKEEENEKQQQQQQIESDNNENQQNNENDENKENDIINNDDDDKL